MLSQVPCACRVRELLFTVIINWSIDCCKCLLSVLVVCSRNVCVSSAAAPARSIRLLLLSASLSSFTPLCLLTIFAAQFTVAISSLQVKWAEQKCKFCEFSGEMARTQIALLLLSSLVFLIWWQEVSLKGKKSDLNDTQAKGREISWLLFHFSACPLCQCRSARLIIWETVCKRFSRNMSSFRLLWRSESYTLNVRPSFLSFSFPPLFSRVDLTWANLS